MPELEKIKTYKEGLSLRLKVCILLFLVVSSLTILTTFTVYRVLERALFKELQKILKFQEN